MATQNIAALFDRSLEFNAQEELKEWDSVIRRVFRTKTTNRRYRDLQALRGYAPAQRRNIGQRISQGDAAQSFTKRIFVLDAGIADVIPMEDIEDDPTGMLTQGGAAIGGGLMRALTERMELDAAAFFVNGFTVTANTYDGVTLFNSAHPVAKDLTSITYATRGSSDADLSIDTLQAAITAMRTQKKANGSSYANIEPDILLVSPTLEPTAWQITRSGDQPYTTDRNRSTTGRYGIEVIAWPYFTDTDMWVLLGKQHFLEFVSRQGFRSKSDTDIMSNSLVVAATCRYNFDTADAHGIYGSLGA